MGHLARRFAGALSPAGPDPAAEEWVSRTLSEPELALWRRMSGPDRRHAVGVARRVSETLGPSAAPPVLAAALLHDVGKIEAGIGTFARVGATAAGVLVGHRRAQGWAAGRGPLRRVGQYLDHARIGAELLSQAASDPLTVSWAAEHHLPPEHCHVPMMIAGALKAADDD